MFVTFEGPEGAGKSTVIKLVAERLGAAGKSVLLTREPGGSPLGLALREMLLHGDTLAPTAELFLFLADRSQHCASVIRPALDEGKAVLCDRFADSTVVYQGHARGLDIERLRALNDLATGGLKPDLTLLLDLPAELGLSRLQSKDRLDAEPVEFHRAVREGFLAEARHDPSRWAVLDATKGPQEVLAQAWGAIRGRFDT